MQAEHTTSLTGRLHSALMDHGQESSQIPRPRRGRLRALAPWLIVGLLPVVMLTALQRRLIYLPTVGTPDVLRASASLEARVFPVSFPTSDGLSLNAWFFPSQASQNHEPAEAVRDGRPVCLILHGNAGHRGHRLTQLSVLRRMNVHSLVIDYRGYGENPGSPSETGLRHDARGAWDYLVHTLGCRPDQVILYGESLGGGVATQLAADLCSEGSVPAGLFLQSTFTSLVDAAAWHYPFLPVRWLMVDRFESIARIGSITCPLLIVHGLGDTIVPFSQGEALSQAAPAAAANGIPRRFVRLPDADHNDIFETSLDLWRRELHEFVQSIIAAAPAP